jgi:hypothetical protein
MNEMILQMAKAHLQNVADRRDQLLTQRGELTKKIEEIEEFLKKGLQVVAEAAKVDSDKPKDEYKPPTDMERHARRKDFS